MYSELCYPIKFKPILKEKIWGGEQLMTKFNKKSTSKTIGESWELSGVENDISVVENGALKGTNLPTLIEKYTSAFVGDTVYKKFGNQFPLLFKFIDAKENLSIQLHPNDQLAKERHQSFGKTEMWYVLEAEKPAKLYAGFNRPLNKNTYLEAFNKGKILDIICTDAVQKRDAFFIEVGTIHAIGKGVLIAEIQQTSDITYRVYDWDRTNQKGEARELHIEAAMDAFDFNKIGSCKLAYQNTVNTPNTIFSCNYFTTNKLNIKSSITRNIDQIDSFIVYMCVEGSGSIETHGKKERLQKGETVLIPAFCNQLVICSTNNLELLEVYI